MKKLLFHFIFFIFCVCISVIMAYCTACYYEINVTIYLFFICTAFTILFALALFKIKDLKKQLQQQYFIDKHVQFAKEHNTKVYVIDATKEDQKIDCEQALGIGFELNKRAKENSK